MHERAMYATHCIKDNVLMHVMVKHLVVLELEHVSLLERAACVECHRQNRKQYRLDMVVGPST